MNYTTLRSFLIVLASLVSTAHSKGMMKGCHHHKMNKMMKGCGVAKAPTQKPVARMLPTRKPSKAPATGSPTPNKCPDALRKVSHNGFLYALVEQLESRDGAFAAAAMYNCCGAQGVLSPFNERSSVVIPSLLNEGEDAWVADTEPSACRYLERVQGYAGNYWGPCDIERFFFVEFNCVA
jgi:hypothetical protein